MFTSVPSLPDMRCNQFMRKLNENLPSLDGEICRTIQQIFFENCDNLENFKACIEKKIDDPQIKKSAIKTAELYLQVAMHVEGLEEPQRKKRKGGTLAEREPKRLRLTPREKRKAEDSPIPEESKRRRLDLVPTSDSTTPLMVPTLEKKPLSCSFSEGFRRLSASSDDEEMIEICTHLHALAVNRRYIRGEKDVSKIPLEDLSFLFSLLSNQNPQIALSAWTCLTELLASTCFNKIFSTNKQIEMIIPLIEKMAEEYEQLPNIKQAHRPLCWRTMHLQKLISSGYRALIFCRQCSEKVSDDMIKKAVDFFMPILEGADDDAMVAEAYGNLCFIYNKRKTFLPANFDIESKGFELFIKLAHSGNPDIILHSLRGLSSLISEGSPIVWQQMENAGWQTIIQFMQNENEEIAHFALAFLATATVNLSLQKKNEMKDIARQLLEIVISSLSHENCWIMGAACRALLNLLTFENFPQLFCQGKGVKTVISTIESLAREIEQEGCSPNNETQDTLSDLALKCEQNFALTVACLQKCLTFFTPEMATEITHLMLQLAHSPSRRIAAWSIRFLGELSFMSKEKFQGFQVDIGAICCETLMELISALHVDIVESAINSLNRMSWNPSFKTRSLEIGGIEKLCTRLKQPHALFVKGALLCLATWMRAKNGTDQVDAVLFDIALTLLQSEEESLLAQVLQAFSTMISDKGFTDELGVRALEKMIPLLKAEHIPLLNSLYHSFGKLADPQRKFTKSVRILHDIELLKQIKEMLESDVGVDPGAAEGICVAFSTLLEHEMGEPLERLCSLTKLTKHKAEKVVETALWLIHKIAIKSTPSPQNYLNKIAHVSLAAIVDCLESPHLKIITAAVCVFGTLAQGDAYELNDGTVMKTAIDALIEKLALEDEKTRALILRALGTALAKAPAHKNYQAYVAERALANIIRILQAAVSDEIITRSLWVIAALSPAIENRPKIKQLIGLDTILKLLKNKSTQTREGVIFLMNNLATKKSEEFIVEHKEEMIGLLLGLLHEKGAIDLLWRLFFHFPAFFSDQQKKIAIDFLMNRMKSNLTAQELVSMARLLNCLIVSGVENLDVVAIQLELLRNENKIMLGSAKGLLVELSVTAQLLIEHPEAARWLIEHPEGLQRVPIEDRLKLYTKIALSDSNNATLVAKNFDHLGLGSSSEPLVDLVEMPAGKLLVAYVFLEKIYANHLQQLEDFMVEKLRRELDSALEECTNLADKWSTDALINGIEKLRIAGASPEECLEVCMKVADQNLTIKRALGHALMNNFERLDLRETPIENRLWLCETLINAGDALIVAKNCGKLGLDDGSVDDRQRLCRKIVKSIGNQLDTCKELASASWEMAKLLVENFDWFATKFSIVELSVKLLELSDEGLLFAYPFLEKAHQHHLLPLRKTVVLRFQGKLDALLEGYNELVLLRQLPPEEQINRVEMLLIAGGSLKQCVELCKTIALSSDEGAELIAANFGKFGLSHAPIEDRLTLCKAIIPSEEGAGILSESFHLLGLQKLTSEQLTDLFELPGEAILKGYDFFEKLYEQHPQEQLQQRLISQLQAELSSLNEEPEAQCSLAEEICNHMAFLQLQEEDPLIQQAIAIGAKGENPEANNPIVLYRKLQKLAEEPLAKNIHTPINIEQLRLTASRIERDDLPKEASLASFNKLFTALKNKNVTKEGQETSTGKAALAALDTNWAVISFPIEGDPSRFLLNLLHRTEGVVSDVEAQWKAVLNNVLSKNIAQRKDEYFSEQEEVFIKTMMVIQACEGGKADGISRVYNLLPPDFQYKAPLSKPRAINAQENLANLIVFLESAPKEKDPAVFLYESAKTNSPKNRDLTAWAYGLFAEDPRQDDFLWYDDDQLNGEITLAGAQEIIRIKEEGWVAPLVAQSVQKGLMAQFSGDNALMKELTGEENIEQGAHQSIYLKNLIGPLLGISARVSFDQNTTTLYEALIEKSREEVLEIFFKHFTPETMANELSRDLNQATPEEKEHVKKFLPEQKYWSDPSTIALEGALALLRWFKYLK